MTRHTAAAKPKKQNEAIPKGAGFMPKLKTEQIAAAFQKEPVGKPKSILETCLLYREGRSIRGISKMIRVSYSTVRGWLLRMMNADLERRYDKKHPGQTRKLDERLVSMLHRCLGNPPNMHGFRAGAWTLDMAIELVRWRFGITYKPRTMRRILNSLGYSYRKPRPIPDKSATPEKQEEFKKDANRQVVDLIKNDYVILSEDEAACQKWSSGGYAWRRTGGHDTVDVSFSKATIKLIGAIGKDDHHIRVVDALNSETFIDFLKMLYKIYPKFALVLDNASYHKSVKVNEFIESAGGNIVLIFLPPHTPQLNPIEMQWRELKRLLSGQCFKSLEDLKDAVEVIVAKEMKTVKLMPYLTTQYNPS